MGAVPGQYRLVRGCKGSMGAKMYGGGTCKTVRGRYVQNGTGAVHAKRYGAKRYGGGTGKMVWGFGQNGTGRYMQNGMGHWAKRYGGGTGKNGTGALRAKRYGGGTGKTVRGR